MDLQLNLLSEQENTKMIGMLHAIAAKVGADLTQVALPQKSKLSLGHSQYHLR